MTNTIDAGRTVVGRVVSDKMDKTIVVALEWKVKHPLYEKYVTRSSKMYAHDAENTGKVGDLVRIKSSRPLSKTKNWLLLEVLERASKEVAE